MDEFLHRIMEKLRELGVKHGFQLIVRVGQPDQPAVCLWAIKPPRGLGDSTTLRFEASGPFDDAAAQVFSEIGIEPVPNLGVLVRHLQRLFQKIEVESFNISFNHYPGYHGPKIWLSAKGINITTNREDLAEALTDIFHQLESRLAALA